MAARRRRPSAFVWMGVVVGFCVVQIVREQVIGAAVCGAGALVIGADGLGLLPPAPVRGPVSRYTLAGVATAVAVTLCAVPRSSIVMTCALLAVLAATLVAVWPQPPESRPRSWSPALRVLGVSWAVILGAGCMWELLEFFAGRLDPRLPTFTLSALLGPTMATTPGRIVGTLVWVAVGWFLLTRART